MRAARVLVPIAVSAFVVTLPGVAQAATTVSTSGMPSGYTFYNGDCNLNPVASGSPPSNLHVTGPATPPLGTGSLRVTFTQASAADFYKDYSAAGKTIGDVTSASFSSYTPTGSGAGAWMYVVGDDNTTTSLAYVQAPTNAGWSTTNLLTAPTIYVDQYADAGGAFQGTSTTTWSSFKSTHAADSLVEEDVWMDSCSGGTGAPTTGAINIDKVTMGPAGTNTINFEAPPSALSIGASKNTIVYGSTVTMKTKLTKGGAALAGKHVLLYARKAGASSFSKVADVVTSSTGVATSKQAPKLNTTYKWVFNGALTIAPSTSSTKLVKVARKLTLSIADTTLSASQQLKASGRETPAKAGSLVNVYRHNTSGTTKIGSATVHTDGTWSLSKDMPTGKFSVYATSPADTKFAAGKSPTITVTSA